MAETSNEQQHDTWTESMTNFTEAARHSLTASRLAAAGAVALGAAAAAYLWDTDRRNSLLQQSKKMSDDMMAFWNSNMARSGRGEAGADSRNA